MADNELHADLSGWWRITETSQWVNDGLDDLGLASAANGPGAETQEPVAGTPAAE